MRKYTLKASLLACLIAITLVLSASCSLIPGLLQNACPHDRVSDGDCQTPGKCLACGKTVGELKEHVYKGRVVYPDCKNGGYTEYACSVCGDSYRENPTDPTEHTFGEWIFTKDPTATENGEMYRECSVCHTRENETVSAHVHSMASGSSKAVTCTDDGWESYEYCTKCEYSTKMVIKATGHSWGAYVSSGEGTHTRICANDSSHVLTELCSGGDVSGSSLPICDYCHTAYDFAARAGNSSYGYYALGTYATYGAGMQRLYKELTKVCEQFLTSDENVPLEDNYYIIGEYDLSEYSLDVNAGSAVWKVFYVSNPVYYWLDAKIVTRGDTLILTIADDYAAASARRTADAAIKAMTDECNLLIKDGMTDLEKAVTISAYITENMEYAYEADGTTPVEDMWAHCMAGFAMHGRGVCEAYAKSFMYLCLLNGVDCRMGSGYAGEPHAWNYVKLGDEWYGADITWTDNSGDLAVYDYFGLSGASIFKDHQSHTSTTLGGDFIYAPPTLASENIELTALYKNGEYAGMYKSIEDAFLAMTDSTAEYEIKIDFYGFFVSSPTHSVGVSATPNVKKLTITGRTEYVGPSHLDNNSILRFSSALTLGSDVVLQNVHLIIDDSAASCPIELNGHTLTLGGNTVYMDNRITGTKQGSKVIVATADVAYVYGGVDVYELDTGIAGILLGADSNIQRCKGKKIYVPAADNPDEKVNVNIVNYI